MAEQYNEAKVKAVGDALYNMIDAVKDGVGINDMDEFIALTMALQGAQAELAGDTDAAVLHIASALTDKLADARVNQPPSS